MNNLVNIDSTKNARSILYKNTIMLYIMTFSSYFLSFITVPYQTRVLGPEKYGLIGVATALMAYFRLVIDFGFLLSATEEVANYRDDKKKLSNILTSVTLCKIVLSVVSFVVLYILCTFVDQWKGNTTFFTLYFVAIAISSFVPDYLYRGIEQMQYITIRSVAIKVLFTCLIFIFVKSSDDYMLIPILQLVGNLLSLLYVYVDLFARLRIFFSKVRFIDIVCSMKKSFFFFLSRIATTVYTVSNTIILDILSRGTATAYYTTADKLVSTAKQGFSPVADSLYPYMVRNKDFNIIKKSLLIIEPIVILGCAILFVCAEPICVWFFGSEYAQTGNVLRALLPIIVVTFPNYIFGFPMLGAMGLSKHANYSTLIGSIIHVLNLCILFFTGNMNIITLAITTSVTECVVLAYRCIVIYRNKKMFRK